MKFDIVTIFPRMVEAGLADGIVGRARDAGLLDVAVHDLRDFTTDRHHVVDDVPFGGGPGMVMKPEPFFVAMERIGQTRGRPDAVWLMSPAGRRFTQGEARRLAGMAHVAILCGRYEGIDERVRESLATDEVSIGDYVLSGGELPAMVVVDAVARLIPGVVGDDQSVEEDSFSRGLLDYPHYTRPAEYDGRRVPDVLLSGHHAEIRRWRTEQALRRTMDRRPELMTTASLDERERRLVTEWGREARTEQKGS
jgi:tRNA (guanine37-N1)-methyltransferase